MVLGLVLTQLAAGRSLLGSVVPPLVALLIAGGTVGLTTILSPRDAHHDPDGTRATNRLWVNAATICMAGFIALLLSVGDGAFPLLLRFVAASLLSATLMVPLLGWLMLLNRPPRPTRDPPRTRDHELEL